jgi:acylphosphatase
MENKVRAHAIISGRVQGVFFRMETKRAADGFGVLGWVRNRRDGTVEALFEGDQDRVDAVLAWCKEGPAHARVSDVSVDWEAYVGGFSRFEITY